MLTRQPLRSQRLRRVAQARRVRALERAVIELRHQLRVAIEWPQNFAPREAQKLYEETGPLVKG